MVPGREACEHYSLLPTPASRGEPAVVSSQEHQALEEGEFCFNCSFACHRVSEGLVCPLLFHRDGEMRETCHRKGGGGVALAISSLLKPPAMAKTQRRWVGNKQCPGYHLLLLLSSTQVAKDFWGIRRFKTASHGQAERIPVWLSDGDVPGLLRLQRRRDSAMDLCKPPALSHLP